MTFRVAANVSSSRVSGCTVNFPLVPLRSLTLKKLYSIDSLIRIKRYNRSKNLNYALDLQLGIVDLALPYLIS
jgi:hypothetical protein